MIKTYAYHYEWQALISASAEDVFGHADQPSHFSSHMSERSAALAGNAMGIESDGAGGKAIGSHMRLSGKVMGTELHVEAVVTERIPNRRKVWETIGKPRLLVVGSYRMGFDITPQDDHCSLRVFIDYDLPTEGFSRFIGFCLGRLYAKWCTRRMVLDTARKFAHEK